MQSLHDRIGIFPTIQHRDDGDQIRMQLVVDGEWKTLGERAKNTFEGLRMDATIELQRIDIGLKAVQEIGANSGLLRLIKVKADQQVFFRRLGNAKPHHP